MIVIITILASLLLPALQAAKAQAQVASCIGNLRQIGIAIYAYTDDNEDSLPLLRHDGVTGEIFGGWWFKRLSSYVGAPLSTAYTDNRSTVFSCPAHQTAQVYTAYGLRLSYGAVESLKSGGGVFVRFGRIQPLVDEKPLKIQQFTEPGEAALLGENNNYIRFAHFLNLPQYISWHHDRLMTFPFADGHAAAVSYSNFWLRAADASDKIVHDY